MQSDEKTASPYPLVGTEHYVSVRNVRLRYRAIGQGDPVILIHGFTGFLDYWAGAMTALSQAGWQAISYDQPAHGFSDIPLKPFSPELFSDYLLGLMDLLEIEKAVLVGHSMGGAIAITTALRAPERLTRLVLVDSVAYPVKIHSWIARLNFFLMRLPVLGDLIKHLPPTMANIKAVRKASVHRQEVNSPQLLEFILQVARRPGFMPYLATIIRRWHLLELYTSRANEIEHPTLLIWGEHDRLVPLEYGMALSQNMPCAQMVTLPDCGHEPYHEAPALFEQTLLDFLKKELVANQEKN